MHRVELKEVPKPRRKPRYHQVPNAPCGVERRFCQGFRLRGIVVPNAPCGVESRAWILDTSGWMLFLMHRVELKESKTCKP